MSYHPYAQPQHGYQQQHQAYHPQYDPPLANQPGPFDSAALGGGQQQSAAYSADGCPHGAQPPAAYVPHYMAVPLGPPQLPAQHQQYQYQQHQASSSSAAQQPLAYRPAAPPQQQQHAGPGPTTASTQQQRPLAPPPPPPPQQQQQPVEKGREGGKKMTVHPVKNACLNCRSRKMKCTGEQPICLNCSKKSIACEYVKSKRGGARKRKDPSGGAGSGAAEDPLALFLQRMTDLASFKASTDASVDLSALGLGGPADGKARAAGEGAVVREYASMREVVEAYHAIIYPYLPILPPPTVLPVDQLVPYLTVPSSSPPSSSAASSSTGGGSSAPAELRPTALALAFLAILVLHPHPSDPAPHSARSKALRRQASEAFARRALADVDDALERAGADGGDDLVDIGVVQTLIVMVTWEFAEKGNMVKMRLRQGHALQLAMDLGLHRSDRELVLAPQDEWQRDMRRRTWWIAFAQLCQASVLSGIPPSLPPFDPRITAEFPACTLDPELWPNQMGAIRHISRVFQLIIQADFPQAAAPDAIASSTALSSGPFDDPAAERERLAGVHREMVALDRKVLLSLRELEKKSVREVRKGMGAEEHMAHNFQTSTLMSLSTCEIALHRRAAFPEVAFFSKKLCGLPSLNARPGPFGSTSNAGRTPISPAQLIESARVSSLPPSSTASSSAPLPTLSDSGTPRSAGLDGSATGAPSAFAVAKAGTGSGRSTGPPTSVGALDDSPAVEGTWGSEDVPLAIPVAGWVPPTDSKHQPSPLAHQQHQPYAPMDSGSSSAYGQQQRQQGSFDVPMPGPAHNPWYATDSGAASLVFNADANPYAALLGTAPGPGTGFGFLPDQWAPTTLPPPSFETVDRFALNVPDLQPYMSAFPELLAGQQPQQAQQPDYSSYAAYAPPPPAHVQQQQQPTPPQGATLSQQSRSASASVHSASPSAHSHSPLSGATPPAAGQSSAKARPWGLDDRLQPTSHLVASPANQVARLTPAERLNAHGEPVGELLKASDVPDGPFPPGLSLERCSAAAHSIVRLETLQRTAAFMLLDGPVRALPFCACGLMASAYCFLLLALAIQAGESFDPAALEAKKAELDGLYTNVRVILAGLAKYAEVWDGLSNLAQEVKSALDAAISLSDDLQHQRLTAADDDDDDDDDGMSDSGSEAGEYEYGAGASTGGGQQAEYGGFEGWQD